MRPSSLDQTNTPAPSAPAVEYCDWCEDGSITGIVGRCRAPWTRRVWWGDGKTSRFCDRHYEQREHMRPASADDYRMAFAMIEKSLGVRT